MTRAADWPFVDTERLHLRPATVADYPALEAAVASPEFPRDLLLAQLLREGGLMQWLEQMCSPERGTRLWSVDDRATRECIGQVSLVPGDSSGEWWIFYWLAPERWGTGLAREAVRALLAAAFELPEYAAVHAAVAETNQRSRSLLEALGFALAQAVPGDFHVPDGHLMYSMRRAAWDTSSEAIDTRAPASRATPGK